MFLRNKAKRCERTGHVWWPCIGPYEFITTQDICSRCGASRIVKPYGQCLGKHPIAEHYDEVGNLIPVETCKAGGPA